MSTLRAPLMGAQIAAAETAPPRFLTKDFLIRLVDWIGAWQDRAAERRRLLALDDRILVDIGIDRATAIAEAQKPFWRA